MKSLDDAQMQLVVSAEQLITRPEDGTSWLKRADRMTVKQLQELRADLADRVARMGRTPHHSWTVLQQLKKLKLCLKQKIEEKEREETTGSVAAVQIAA